MVQLTHVSKLFRSGRGTVRALNDISLTVDTDHFIVLMGKSGSGKSTLLNCIAGIEQPDEGTIICFGTDICQLHGRQRSLFQRRHIGFIFQKGNLLSYLTVAENIGFPLALNGITGIPQRKRIDQLLDLIGLADTANALPNELSAGEAQRVAVARAIAHQPRLLLADEPTANLDSETGQHIVKLIRQLGKTHHCTIIMATHDMEISVHADGMVQLKDGCIYGGS